MAARSTATSVGFYERAAKHSRERRHLRQELAATVAQNGGRDVLHSERVHKATYPSLDDAESWINARRRATQNRLDKLCERDETKRVDDHWLDARSRPRLWIRPIGPLATHGEAAT